MIRSSRITAFIGDGDYELELRIGELRLLQAALNSGPFALLDRLQARLWYVDDIIETIRLGLIGGGMGHQDAKRLTDAYVCSAYLAEYIPLALHVLLAALFGDQEDAPEPEDDDEPGEPIATQES